MTSMQQKQKAVDFINVVRERFTNQPSKFIKFTEILVDFRTSKKFECEDLINLFADDHQDLLCELIQFLPRNYETCSLDKDDTPDEYDPPNKKRKFSGLLAKSDSEFFDKIRDRFIEKNDDDFNVLMKFAESIVLYHEKKITVNQLDLVCRDLFKDDPDLYVESTLVIGQTLKKEKGPGLGFSLKNRKTVRHWTSYDKTMSAKEFYLYEMDMAFSRIDSTIKKLEEDPEKFGECFTVHDFKCIVGLYNGSDSDSDDGFGEEIVDILRCGDPVGRLVARGIILERLRQKKKQLEEQKLRLDQVWKEIFEDIREKGVVCRHREFLKNMINISKSENPPTN